MNAHRFVKPLTAVALMTGLIVAGYIFRETWLPRNGPGTTEEPVTSADEATIPANKIIVGDQAQKNLKITAKPLKVEVFWKTIAVQGMVVDRPGISDREMVAPAIGTIGKILHVPGDTVRPGDALFTLKLASEPLHQTQTDLFKTTQELKLTEARRKRLAAAGEAIAQARIIEVESEISRLEAAAKSYRQELMNRGLTRDDIDGIAAGELLSEISIVVPPPAAGRGPPSTELPAESTAPTSDSAPQTFEVQELQVDLGQQVQAGQTLCHLSNHQLLAIEGRAFRDETSLLERSIKEGWPVEVDFQEDAAADWPTVERTFRIQYIANTIDPVTRTFAFQMPLENQSKTVDHGGKTHRLWRFRPGQKVRLQVRVEKLDNVFVLPADGVVVEGAEAYVFTQNVNTFEPKGVHLVFRDRERAVFANDGSLPTYRRNDEVWTIAAIVRSAAAQMNRMIKAGSSGAPKGYHIHADGSLHKNEDEGK